MTEVRTRLQYPNLGVTDQRPPVRRLDSLGEDSQLALGELLAPDIPQLLQGALGAGDGVVFKAEPLAPHCAALAPDCLGRNPSSNTSSSYDLGPATSPHRLQFPILQDGDADGT